MSVQYDLYETPSPDGEEGKKSLHARVCPIKTISQKEFIEHVATYEMMPKNMIPGALSAIVDDLCYLLSEGYVVEMGELGFFSTSLNCDVDMDEEGQVIKKESVSFKNVNLRISSEFRKRLVSKMKFERVHSLTRKPQQVTSTVDERKEKLKSFLKKNFCITRKEYSNLTFQTPYDALKEINSFISQDILRRRGSRKSSVYVAGENLSSEYLPDFL